jgi:hypothetical protein
VRLEPAKSTTPTRFSGSANRKKCLAVDGALRKSNAASLHVQNKWRRRNVSWVYDSDFMLARAQSQLL